MQLRSFSRLIDATTLITLTVALMYVWGRFYLRGFLQACGLDVQCFEISFYEYVSYGHVVLVGVLLGGPLGGLLSVGLDKIWERFFAKKRDVVKPKAQPNRVLALSSLALILVSAFLYLGYEHGLNGGDDYRVRMKSAPVFVQMRLAGAISGDAHLLIKLGGYFVVYIKTDEPQGKTYLIPESEVIQIVRL